MKHSSRMPAAKESVMAARDFVMNSIGPVPSDVRDAIMVVTSELTSNAVRHGASSFEVRIEQHPDRIVIEVDDDSGGDPVLRSPGPTDTSGRGLQITKALADSWGVRRIHGSVGKTVWAVVSIPGSRVQQLAQESATQTVTAQEGSPNRSISNAGKLPSSRPRTWHGLRIILGPLYWPRATNIEMNSSYRGLHVRHSGPVPVL